MPFRRLRRLRDRVVHNSEPGSTVSTPPTATPACTPLAVVMLPPGPPPLPGPVAVFVGVAVAVPVGVAVVVPVGVAVGDVDGVGKPKVGEAVGLVDGVGPQKRLWPLQRWVCVGVGVGVGVTWLHFLFLFLPVSGTVIFLPWILKVQAVFLGILPIWIHLVAAEDSGSGSSAPAGWRTPPGRRCSRSSPASSHRNRRR